MTIPDHYYEDKNLMVIWDNEVWGVYRQDPNRHKPIKSFVYKKQAVKYAIALATKEGMSLTIYPKPYERPTTDSIGC